MSCSLSTGSRHQRWLATAMRLCRHSTFARYRMAAILVRGGRVVARGVNRDSPGACKVDCYHYLHHQSYQAVHAELDVLRGLSPADLKGATLYVAGMTDKGTALMSKPCPECQIMLERSGVAAVYYHDRDGRSMLLT